LIDIIHTNCREFQELGRAIKFPFMLIWIEMEQYSPVSDPTFTINKVPLMEKYRVFAVEEASSSNSLPPKDILRLWVVNLKNASHRWCVEKAIL